MKLFKTLSVFTVAGLLLTGCQNSSTQQSAEQAAAPTPMTQEAPHAPEATEEDLGASHAGVQSTTGDVTIEPGSIAKADYTVAEMYEKKADVNGKAVKLRGKVVKFSAGIMGKNWVHLRDGSGTEGAGTNDLTVTTQANAVVGDTVVVSGTATADKDFGAGYNYLIIVEDAEITVE